MSSKGRTLIEMLFDDLWSELDTIVDHLMSEGEPSTTEGAYGAELGNPEDWKEWGEWRGQAQGITFALARLKNPYKPDIEAIRAEAMQRWEDSQ